MRRERSACFSHEFGSQIVCEAEGLQLVVHLEPFPAVVPLGVELDFVGGRFDHCVNGDAIRCEDRAEYDHPGAVLPRCGDDAHFLHDGKAYDPSAELDQPVIPAAFRLPGSDPTTYLPGTPTSQSAADGVRQSRSVGGLGSAAMR